jgi:hypothetical protein
MFHSLEVDILDRILAARHFWLTVRKRKDRKALATAKGLLFVQLYAIYEFSVTGIVQAALLQFNSAGVSPDTARLELLTIILDQEFTAATDPGTRRERLWYKRIELLESAFSSSVRPVKDTFFPSDGAWSAPQKLVQVIW